uniref:Uncharacterized protein n=1 Tax=Triticum urartu TaxID=4572 RepID=A0A8R7PD19_TRIUA
MFLYLGYKIIISVQRVKIVLAQLVKSSQFYYICCDKNGSRLVNPSSTSSTRK